MQVWNVLHAARWNTGRKKIAKNSPSGHRGTTLLGYVFAIKDVSTIGKKHVKHKYLPHMSLKYGELRPTNGWDWFVSWGTPANFNGFRVLASLYCSDVAERKRTKLCTMFVRLLGCRVHYIYIFGGSCPVKAVTEFCQVQNSLCVQVLRYPIGLLAALLHDTRVVGVSQTAALSRGRHLITYIRQGGHHFGHQPTF